MEQEGDQVSLVYNGGCHLTSSRSLAPRRQFQSMPSVGTSRLSKLVIFSSHFAYHNVSPASALLDMREQGAVCFEILGDGKCPETSQALGLGRTRHP